MIILVIILGILCLYFFLRLFLLKKNIKNATDDIKEINMDIYANRELSLSSPDKDLENFLFHINKSISSFQMDRIRYMRKETSMKKDIENISHDLRTPLTSIRGYLDLMDDKSISDEERSQYLAVVKRKSLSLQSLIQSFYDLSRLEACEYAMSMEDVDIHKELVEELLIYYNDFIQKNIDVSVEGEDYPLFAMADKNAVHRIMSNLIQNALKYSISYLKISVKSSGSHNFIYFSNDCKGLTDEDCVRIFERFYMKNSSRTGGSSGLGLTVTKLLMQNMGADISASINKGALNDEITFTLKFPAVKKEVL